MVRHLTSAAYLARRGLEHVGSVVALDQQYMAKLEEQAQEYERSGPHGEFGGPGTMLMLLATVLLFFVLLACIDYAIGDVMASLAMIESPSSVAIVEPLPPAYKEYADEPDAPLAKERRSIEQPDVEITLMDKKLVTASIRDTSRLLKREFGFFGRLRGVHFSVAYHFVHALLAQFCLMLSGMSIVLTLIASVLITLLLARFHMLWTHSMIAKPTNKRVKDRLVPTKDCKVLLIPATIFALAQQALIFVPLGVAWLVNIAGAFEDMSKVTSIGDAILPTLRFLAIPASFIAVVLDFLLPASIVLTRIEAALLPHDMQTVVPFDREAVLGDYDLTVIKDRRAVFRQTWRSVDRSVRWRLIKLYAKNMLIQFVVIITAVHVLFGELFLAGGSRIGPFLRSARAQLELAFYQSRQV